MVLRGASRAGEEDSIWVGWEGAHFPPDLFPKNLQASGVLCPTHILCSLLQHNTSATLLLCVSLLDNFL